VVGGGGGLALAVAKKNFDIHIYLLLSPVNPLKS